MKYALASISAGNRRNIDSNRQVEPRRELVDAGSEAAVREDRGKDSVCQLAQFRVALLRVLERFAEERLRLFVSVSERSLSELERDDGVHQSLLRAVVQVAHHAAAGLVCLGEQTRPRGCELVTAVGVGDGGVEQLGELGHPLFGVGRRRLLARPARRDHAPEPAVHDDRRSDGDTDTHGPRKLGNAAVPFVEDLDPGRAAPSPSRCRPRSSAAIRAGVATRSIRDARRR
jgi:hypothetical protein